MREMWLLSDEELVECAKNGDEDAFIMLQKRFDGFILFHARKTVVIGMPMEDVLQECGIFLLRAIRTYDPQKGTKFSTYFSKALKFGLINIGRRYTAKKRLDASYEAAMNYIRSKNPYDANSLSELELADMVAESPETYLLNKELVENIENDMEELLTDVERSCMNLSTLGYTYPQISIMLQREARSVASAILRARAKMRLSRDRRNKY